MGFGLQAFVVTWLAYDITQTASAIGTVLAISTIPRILLSPFIGVLVDIWNRKKTIVVVQFLRSLLLIIIPLAILIDSLNLLILYVVTFLWNVVDRFYMPAFKGLMKELLTNDELLKGNTSLNVTFQIGMIIGTAIAGFLFEYIADVFAVFFNSILFIIAAISILSIRQRKNNTLKKKNTIEFHDFFVQLKSTAKYLSARKIIVLFGCLVALNEFVIQIVNIIMVPYVTKILAEGPATLSLLEGIFAVGSIVGGLCLIRIIKLMGRRNFIWMSIAALGGLLCLIPVTKSILIIGTVMFFLGAVALQSRTLFSTIILEKVDNNFQGRVNSIINMFISLLGAFIYSIIGKLGEVISIQIIIYLIGMFVILCSTIGILINKLELMEEKEIGSIDTKQISD
ncbi:MFS transporter [Geobacillus sp. A8]|uniref:MFS transporter n=1 Tax=Geobacillus sp. A8 TaxID=1095383 RepID=UPI0009DBEB05|nr:MFS transporter [Geobacillus sp. A8]